MPDPTTLAFRFGFGLPLPAGAPQGVPEMLTALAGPDRMAMRYPGPRFDEVQPKIRATEAGQKAARVAARKQAKGAEEEGRAAYAAGMQDMRAGFVRSAQIAVARALESPDGFRERLVRFWADHFTVTARRPPHVLLPATLVEDAIRPHVAGSFRDLLTAVTLHPAMLFYLDQTSSTGPGSKVGQRREKGLNENLARELLELHTLGVGSGYTQADVRQLAELLTGLAVGKEGFLFDRRRAEPGAETILGQTYSGDTLDPILAFLGDLSQRPETARHIGRKLAVHFVSDTPDPAIEKAVEKAWKSSGGDLLAVYEAFLLQPAVWDSGPEKARQPFDFLVAALRGLGIDGATVAEMDDKRFRRLILAPLAAMGQSWQGPPGPDGWPEAIDRWISPQGMATRIIWAMEAPGRLAPKEKDPVAVMTRALGPRASQALAWAVPKAETQRDGIGLVFAAPEFNRR